MAQAYFCLMVCTAIIVLAGCSSSAIRWQDTSGKSRGQDLARIDLERCKQKLRYPDTVASQTLACMSERGWRRI
jgi:hypothetical protein